MDLTLILFTGLPGTGKSTLAQDLARSLQMPYLAHDQLVRYALSERVLRSTEWTSADVFDLLLGLAETQLAVGVSAIVDEVVSAEGSRRESLAAVVDRTRARLLIVETHCSDETLWEQRIRARMVDDEGLGTPVSWEKVQAMRDSYSPWKAEESLTLDAVHGRDENFVALLEHVGALD